MLYYLGGVAAFGLYVLYDINSVLWKKTILKSFFAAGSLILLFVTISCLWQQYRTNQAAFQSHGYAAFFLLLAVIFFALLIYSLFFALPFEKTYVNPQGKMPVYDRGMYALCRHPGVLWFGFLYLSLALAWNTGIVWGMAGLFSFLNFCYIVIQDRWTFLRTFDDYEGYCLCVPFLIPTRESIRRTWQTRH